MNDDIRTGIIAVVNAAIPIGFIFGLYELSAEDIATIMVFVTTTVTLMARIFKTGQEPDPTKVVAVKRKPGRPRKTPAKE